MGRAPCCDKANVKRGPWSPEEDATLKAYIEKYGTGGNWIALPQKIGLKRCGKSCRLRWLNYLRPNIKHGGFTDEEDNIILNLYISIGSRWSIIAAQLPGRTDNDIKNYWNTRLKKKLLGRRKQQQQGGLNGTKDEVPTLSNSALERLQLHMQLQNQKTQQNSFSFFNNPSLWPKLHPLIQEKLLQNNLQTINQIQQYPFNNNPVDFFQQNSSLLHLQDTTNNKNNHIDHINNSDHSNAKVEAFEDSSPNISASSESSDGANHNDDNNNLGSFIDFTPGALKSSGYTGMSKVPSFQTQLNELLGSDKMVSFGAQEDGQVANELEEMSGWWSTDNSISTSCWDVSTVLQSESSTNVLYQDYA